MIVRFAPKPEELDAQRVGPLGPHIESFAALLSGYGYCRDNGWQKIKLVGDLSRWLQCRRITLQQLDERQTDAFLRARWKQVSPKSGEQVVMSQLLHHLRNGHIIPSPVPVLRGDIDFMEQDFRCFLLQERAFAPASVDQYIVVMKRFLSHRFSDGKVRLKKLCAKDVSEFVLHDTATRGRRSAQFMATVLRSFLSFLFQRGRIAINLSGAVPTVAGWRLSELPRFLDAEEVERVLRCCDRRRKVGKRDYAILLILARLGLRAGEVS